MRYNEVQRLRSEIGTVERFLSELPEDAIIERLSWESRLASLQEQLRESLERGNASPQSTTTKNKTLI